MHRNYDIIDTETHPIKSWTRGVPVDDKAREQLRKVAGLPFIYKWLAVMPDVHKGAGATIGSVIPTQGAIIPAAVGVDIGCGMMAVRTSLQAHQLPDSLGGLRSAIEGAVPHGRTSGGRRGDRGAWHDIPARVGGRWNTLSSEFTQICEKYPGIAKSNHVNHLGTLGTGNHFIEVCLDDDGRVWFMLHSGSRGVGNRIGSTFISMAKKDMEKWFIHLPDHNLAYFPEGTKHYKDYLQAVSWAQRFAAANRELMMEATIAGVRALGILPEFTVGDVAVNCHHNYVATEQHFGKAVHVTRKGAVRAGLGELGIIPGSMGAKSFIVRGKGNRDSFCSCSHGAGRVMSRTEAKKRFSVEDHVRATEGIECRKDAGVIDETPMAYKSIEAVMAAQADLVETVYELRQVVCVKG